MQNEIRILIADDHPIFRQGLRMVIETDPLLRVVAEADDGQSTLARIRELQPHVAVLDIDMPPPDGLAVAHELCNEPIAIIIQTMHKDVVTLRAALDSGVKGYVVKDDAANEIVNCIKAVVAGQSFVSPALSGYLLNRRHRADALASQLPSIDALSATERRILLLVAESMTNKQIAEKMFISVRTVEHHRSYICAKLGLSGKNALLTLALTHKSDL
jgi:DNA-binding NarL/FixJ family response regulator